MALALGVASSANAQVVVTPPAGSSFEVHDQGGNAVLKVEDVDRVLVPGLAGAASGDNVLCFDAVSGALGPCAAGVAVGPTGPVGATGATGATGPIGATGASGATGADGAVGPTGATGAAGSVGAIGPTGATGATGPMGPTGAIGATGATGATGANGANGVLGHYIVRGTAGRLAVTSSTATVQPGMSQAITLAAPADVAIWASIGGRNTLTTSGAYATVDVIIYVDGTFLPAGGWNRFTNVNGANGNAFNACAINTVVSLPAGTHTIELRTLRLAGSTVPVDIGGNATLEVNPGEMTIMVLD